MCQPEACACIFLFVLMGLFAWCILQMEKLNPARSFVHFFIEATLLQVPGSLLGRAQRLAGSFSPRVFLDLGPVKGIISSYRSVFRNVIPKFRERQGMYLRWAEVYWVGWFMETVIRNCLCITLPCMFIQLIKIQNWFQMLLKLLATALKSSCNWISKTWKILQCCLHLIF